MAGAWKTQGGRSTEELLEVDSRLVWWQGWLLAV